MAVYDIVEGTSGTLEFQLLENGVPIDLGGVTVTLLLEDRNGTAIANPGAVSVSDSSNGKIRFVPTSTSVFIASSGPYYARWKLTNTLSAVFYVPSSVRDVWNIVGQ